MRRQVLVLAMVLTLMPAMAQAEMARLYAAGSLKAAMVDMTAAFEMANPGTKVEAVHGASGLLRERSAAGRAILARHGFGAGD